MLDDVPATARDAVRVPDRLYDAYLFDMDGTIYLGDDLLPGAGRLIGELRSRAKTVRFLSNNPTKDPQQYADKRAHLGLPTPIEEIVNTTVTMTRWLLDNHPDAVVFPISEAPLKRAFEGAGIQMSDDPAEIDIVVASYDRGFNYESSRLLLTRSGFTSGRGWWGPTPTVFARSPADAENPTAPP